MQIQIDSERAQWQPCFTGWLKGTMWSSYRVGPTAWQLFVVCPYTLVQQLQRGQLVAATVAHDGCGVMVTIHHQIDRPTLGQPIILLSACQQAPTSAATMAR